MSKSSPMKLVRQKSKALNIRPKKTVEASIRQLQHHEPESKPCFSKNKIWENTCGVTDCLWAEWCGNKSEK
jgi:hypothetical protein